MLIEAGYPNLPHGCDFLCFNLKIINEFEKDLPKRHNSYKSVGGSLSFEASAVAA